MKTITIRLTSRLLMVVAVAVLATGALFAGAAALIGSLDQERQ